MIGHFVHGHGPVRALVLHGWFGDWRVFESMLPALDPERFTFAFMDYRGYGASMGLAGPFDLATIANDALRLADHLGWERFSLVGHSMGGKAALKVATLASRRVERILGVTPVWAGRTPFDEATLGFFRSAADDPAVRAAIIHATTGERLPRVWSESLADRSLASSRKDAFASYFEAWAMEDFAAEVGSLSHEILVVVGAADGGVTQEATQATWGAMLPGVTIEVFEAVGHYPMLEAPPRLARVFEAFLDRQP